MGNSHSANKSKAIDKQIKHDQKRLNREVKILLLGAGDSGKSTVLKQMRLIHASGFSPAEREAFRLVIFGNILSAMQSLLECMNELQYTLDNQTNWAYISLFEALPMIKHGTPYPGEYLQPLKSLWADGGIQETFKKGNTFALNDNVQFFYDDLDRVFQPDYMPTDQDIIQCRIKTTGIVETTFRNGPIIYRMCDVGGQRSERKKWIHCFENVASVLFVVAISGYDCCLVEDRDSNQMYEALMLFDSICNSKWFVNTSMILFLNKVDVFKRKLRESPIKTYFPDYTGSSKDYNQAADYFRKRFEMLNRSSRKQIYVHYTVATDTRLLGHVMNSVSDSILHENVQTLLL
ncbi:guanine nucleotide binding protein, alpha subunit [Zychaea mexicana]|uniref:guanine nucleotide binding protein, alpha subunit n=1 Tax=Zychaea mexicana TaxID=64656 RepID=UPI0022FEFD5E|nr:guanine nucleotide binding protein, alpha subunit [Zychaea mexicana]KAI9493133.1 guanine nucleotide binding protein, alpha subunit [Zychaea mexicana]